MENLRLALLMVLVLCIAKCTPATEIVPLSTSSQHRVAWTDDSTPRPAWFASPGRLAVESRDDSGSAQRDGAARNAGSDFALVVNGTTDGAIQRAIDAVHAAGGGTVLLPPGAYTKGGATWATISIKDHVRILGPLGQRGEWWGQKGRGAVLANDDRVDTLTSPSTGAQSVAASVEGLSFESSNSVGAHIAMPSGTNNFAIRNNSFQGKATAIILNGTSYIVEVTNNFFQGQTSDTVVVDNNTGTGGHTLTFRHNWFRDGRSSALVFRGSSSTLNVQLIANIFDAYNNSGKNVIDWVTGGRTLYCVGNWFEGFAGVGTWAIKWTGDSATLQSNEFSRGTNAIRLVNSSNSVVGMNLAGSLTGVALLIDEGSTNNTVFPTGTSPLIDRGVGTYLMGSTRYRHPQSMARAYSSVGQMVANAGYTTLNWNSADSNTDSMHNVTTYASRLTATIAGKYLVGYSIQYEANAIGVRAGRIVKNGSVNVANLASVQAATTGDDTTIQGAVLVALSAKDYIELQGYQTSGRLLAARGGTSGSWFQMIYMGD